MVAYTLPPSTFLGINVLLVRAFKAERLDVLLDGSVLQTAGKMIPACLLTLFVCTR